MRFSSAFLVYLALCTAPAALADEVFLKNGDRLTGKILSAADAKLVIEPDFAKSTKITIPQGEIASFTTADPLFVELRDGAVMARAQARAEGERIVLAPEDEREGRAITVEEIRRINPEAVRWRGSVAVNGLYGESTTTAASIGISADAARRGETDRVTLSGAYSYGVQKRDGLVATNLNNWNLQGKYDHFFEPHWYAYFGGTAAGDAINRLALRASPSLGAGRQWIDRGNFHFSTEGGGTYLYEKYRLARPTQDFAVRGAYHVDRAFDGGRITVTHNLEYLQSLKDTDKFLVTGDAGVRVGLTASMFSELKSRMIYDNRPGLGSRRTTTELRLGVGLTY